MALTNDGPRMVDPSGRPVMRTTPVDGSGNPGWSYLVNDDSPAVSTSYALMTFTASGGQGQVAPAANALTDIGYVWIEVTSISGAASLTIKITTDAAGDVLVYESSAGTMALGETTATTGAVTFEIAAGGLPTFAQSAALYVWIKTNAGTATADRGRIFWKVG